MALIDFLSPALNVATQAAGARAQATKTVQDQEREAMVQRHLLERQARRDAVADTIRERQMQAEANTQGLRDQLLGLQIQGEERALNAPPRPEYFNPIIGPSGEVQLIDKHNPQNVTRVDGVRARIPKASNSSDHTDDKRSAYVLKRIGILTRPTKGRGDITKPGLSIDEATRQAELEWDTARGQGGTARSPSSSTEQPTQPVEAPTAAGSQQGPIDLGSDEQAAYNEAAQLYQAALKRGVDPERARKAYDAALTKLVQQFGHTPR